MDRLIVRADLPDDADERKRIVTDGLEAGFSKFIIRGCDRAFRSLGVFDSVISEDIETVDVSAPSGQRRAMDLAGSKDILISADSWAVIPVENVIAAFSGTDSKVYAEAGDPEDAKLLLGIMERGVDGVVVDGTSDYRGLLEGGCRAELSEAVVRSVRRIESGDRVCVDTCSMMSPGEGMLIGSGSGCLFLVQSESEENGYVATRPFRVNAGSVHSYLAVPDGRTVYLSEVRSGDTVSLCDRDGHVRRASVGRCKIERRPLLMVTAEIGGKEHSVILQNAETIRLVTAAGSVSVTELKEGDRVLVNVSEGGRHFGMAVDETVSEL